MQTFSSHFEQFSQHLPIVPIYRVTDPSISAIHRFYDTSPISPSGRYIAYTALPFEDRVPREGDLASVHVRDLENGEVVFSATTAAWDTQVGAHAQWGVTDSEFFYNELDGQGRVRGVRLNVFTGDRRLYDCGIYMISPDGRYSATPSIEKLCIVQPGYGVLKEDVEPFRNRGALADDGLFICDLDTGEIRLLASFARIQNEFPEALNASLVQTGGFYGFHVKWSPDGNRLMFLVRWVASNELARKTKNFLITMDVSGDTFHLALSNSRWTGGHHPNWYPDSEHIIMNLRFPKGSKSLLKATNFLERVLRKLKLPAPFNNNPMLFARFRFDGSGITPVSNVHPGSGHPTISPDGKYLLTDAYVNEPTAYSDGTVPLRLIDLRDGAMRILARVPCKPEFSGPNAELRVDPHPAWHNSARLLSFNGYARGRRGVFVADLTPLYQNGDTAPF